MQKRRGQRLLPFRLNLCRRLKVGVGIETYPPISFLMASIVWPMTHS